MAPLRGHKTQFGIKLLLSIAGTVAIALVLAPYLWSFRMVKAIIFVDVSKVSAIESDVQSYSKDFDGIIDLRADSRLNAFSLSCRARDKERMCEGLSKQIAGIEAKRNSPTVNKSNATSAYVLPGIKFSSLPALELPL